MYWYVYRHAYVCANMSYLCPQRGVGTINNITVIFAPCTQILVSKYNSHLKEIKDPWRNGKSMAEK